MKREIALERVLDQTRLAVLENGRLCEMYIERGARAKLAGNIYAGRVQNILPGMNAAFVDIGLNKNAFLYAGDISLDTRDQQQLRAQLEQARIEKMLHSGQMIVCQVTKEPGGTKGPRITGNLTLPGRLCVLLPTVRYAGVSRKIEDEAERGRLFALAQALLEEYGFGAIIRTAGEGAGEAALRADFARLAAMWKRIETEATHSATPRLIQSDGDLPLMAVREMLDEGITQIRTEDEALYEELVQNARLMTPELAPRIQLCRFEAPLFDLLRVDHQLDLALDRHVRLGSGGTLVIDETEALTVIDVNTAKFTGRASLQDTIFKLNCEAADEICRQLRLRDIGGIVIIDFIDMDAPEKREALLEHLCAALAADKNRTRVHGMTSLGLVEMTRKKVRRPLSRQLLRNCPACMGNGRLMTADTLAYRAAREVWRRRRRGDHAQLRILASGSTAEAIRRIGLAEAQGVLVDDGGEEGRIEVISQ